MHFNASIHLNKHCIASAHYVCLKTLIIILGYCLRIQKWISLYAIIPTQIGYAIIFQFVG